MCSPGGGEEFLLISSSRLLKESASRLLDSPEDREERKRSRSGNKERMDSGKDRFIVGTHGRGHCDRKEPICRQSSRQGLTASGFGVVLGWVSWSRDRSGKLHPQQRSLWRLRPRTQRLIHRIRNQIKHFHHHLANERFGAFRHDDALRRHSPIANLNRQRSGDKKVAAPAVGVGRRSRSPTQDTWPPTTSWGRSGITTSPDPPISPEFSCQSPSVYPDPLTCWR